MKKFALVLVVLSLLLIAAGPAPKGGTDIRGELTAVNAVVVFAPTDGLPPCYVATDPRCPQLPEAAPKKSLRDGIYPCYRPDERCPKP